MEENLERRALSLGIELRAEEDGRTLVGTAVPWGQLSLPIGFGFREMFRRGTFRESLAEDDPVALWSHDPGELLGRASAGTMRVHEGVSGLRYEIDLPKTGRGNDVLTLVERGDLTGVSISFLASDDAWETKEDEEIRTVKKARLREISLVTFPAYPQTDVAKRSYDSWRSEIQSFVDAGKQAELDHETRHRELEMAEADGVLD